jgi:hypothetical protein
MQCNKSIEVCADEFSVAIGEIVGVILRFFKLTLVRGLQQLAANPIMQRRRR